MNIIDIDLDKWDGLEPICSECGEICTPEEVDTSFSYEYHGIRGTHGGIYYVSDCCGASIE